MIALWRAWKNRHRHDYEVLRVQNFTVTKGDVVGPFSRLSMKCRGCGNTTSVDKRGTWKVEDFQ